MRFGAHVRRGSEATTGVVEECRRRGADCAQIFLSNPRAWAPPSFTDDAAARFREGWGASGLGPLAAHAPYLVNIASPNPGFLSRSRSLARATARACDRLGVDMLVLHAGAGGGSEPVAARRRAASSLRQVLRSAARVHVLVELLAGTRGAVASTIGEAAALLDEAGDGRIGLCLDICHLFAAGYGLDEPEGVGELFSELGELDLTDRVALVHANDSAFPRGERRDRHAPVGEGFVGPGGWRSILSRPEASELPFVLETPGDADSHAEQLQTLRRLAEGR
ncbi:MAG TPA: deoxyribonuclease IV [Actinomycetota bacterium]